MEILYSMDLLEKIKLNNNKLENSFCGIRGSQIANYAKGAKYYKEQLERNTGNNATDLGTKLHMFILEPNKFDDYYIEQTFEIPKTNQQKQFCKKYFKSKILQQELPFTMTDDEILIDAYKSSYSIKNMSLTKVLSVANEMQFQFKKYIEYLEEYEDINKLISTSDLKFLQECKSNTRNHILAKNLIYGIETNDNIFEQNELTIYWKYKNLVQRSTLDRLIIDFDSKTITLIDLKTSKYAVEFDTKFKEYNYNIQMAFYWKAIEYIFSEFLQDYNINDFIKETRIIVYQTPEYVYNYPINCYVAKISSKLIDKGHELVDKYTDGIIYNMEIDDWSHNKFYYENEGIDFIIDEDE